MNVTMGEMLMVAPHAGKASLGLYVMLIQSQLHYVDVKARMPNQ